LRPLLRRDLRVESSHIEIEPIIQSHDSRLKREDVRFQGFDTLLVGHVVVTEEAHPFRRRR